MSWSEGHGSPSHVAPMGEFTIARPLAPQEAAQRALSVRRAALWPLLGILLGAAWLLLLLIMGALTSWSIGYLVGISVAWLVVVGIAVAIGIPLGGALARSQARYELGRSGVLSVTWNAIGLRLVAENVARTVAYADIRRVRHINGFVVLRMRLSLTLTAPYLLALPPDFVPPEAMERIQAAGARSG